MKRAATMLLAVTLLLGSGAARAFEPYPERERVNHGVIVLRVIEDYATPLTCPAAIARLGEPLLGLFYLVMGPMLECTLYGIGENWCEIRSPDVDWIMGHALRHCFEGDFHPALLPFVELPAPSLRDAPGERAVDGGS